jgi:hypothetical protein
VTHSTAEINGQPLVKKYDDPYNKASNSVNIDINPNNEQTIKGEVDDSPSNDWTLLVHPTSYYSMIAEVMFLHFSVERTCLAASQDC